MTRLVPILRCVKNRASRDVSGLTPRESNEPDPRENDFSRTSLNFFFVLRLALRGLCRANIKTRDTQRPTRRRWAQSTWDQCQAHHNVFVLPPPLCLRLFEKLQSHENHDTTTAKWARNGPQSGPVLVSQGTYLGRAMPFRDASCATFFHGAPKLRELRGGAGARRGCFDGRGSR